MQDHPTSLLLQFAVVGDYAPATYSDTPPIFGTMQWNPTGKAGLETVYGRGLAPKGHPEDDRKGLLRGSITIDVGEASGSVHGMTLPPLPGLAPPNTLITVDGSFVCN